MKTVVMAFLAVLSAFSGVSAHSDDHFFLSFMPSGTKSAEAIDDSDTSRSTCELRLSHAVCETKASTQEIFAGWDKAVCSAASAQYLPIVMKIFDELPEQLRPSLCTMNRIFISDRITSVAFASPILKDLVSPPVGAYIGVRKSTFLHQPSSHDLVTWKEQLAFGGSKDFLANDPKLVQLFYGLKMNHLEQDGIFYVFVHEMGHLIDFNNAINASDCGRFGFFSQTGCHPLPKSWAALSWSTMDTPQKGAGYFLRNRFCYYGCAGKGLVASQAYPVYQSLRESSFLTAYAGVNAMEDFAEFWTWYVLRQFKDPDYRISIPGQGDIEMNTVFKENPKIGAKLQFIEALWNSPSLRYANGR